jgi:phage portal protein BeeE
MQRCLLTDVGRRTLYIEHDLDGLLRGDVASRFEAYRIGREIGVYSSNDIRRFENEPPWAQSETFTINRQIGCRLARHRRGAHRNGTRPVDI